MRFSEGNLFGESVKQTANGVCDSIPSETDEKRENRIRRCADLPKTTLKWELWMERRWVCVCAVRAVWGMMLAALPIPIQLNVTAWTACILYSVYSMDMEWTKWLVVWWCCHCFLFEFVFIFHFQHQMVYLAAAVVLWTERVSEWHFKRRFIGAQPQRPIIITIIVVIKPNLFKSWNIRRHQAHNTLFYDYFMCAHCSRHTIYERPCDRDEWLISSASSGSFHFSRLFYLLRTKWMWIPNSRCRKSWQRHVLVSCVIVILAFAVFSRRKVVQRAICVHLLLLTGRTMYLLHFVFYACHSNTKCIHQILTSSPLVCAWVLHCPTTTFT